MVQERGCGLPHVTGKPDSEPNCTSRPIRFNVAVAELRLAGDDPAFAMLRVEYADVHRPGCPRPERGMELVLETARGGAPMPRRSRPVKRLSEGELPGAG